MKFFETYTSNTLASAENQHYFISEDKEKEQTGRAFYKIFAGGKYNYSFLFSNTIDSTFGNGSVSHMNLVCDEWEILSARVAVVDSCDPALPQLRQMRHKRSSGQHPSYRPPSRC